MSRDNSLFYIVIDGDCCKGCQLCLTACPKKIIKLATSPNRHGYVVVVPGEESAALCTGCLACAIICPDSAITVYQRVTLKNAVEHPDGK